MKRLLILLVLSAACGSSTSDSGNAGICDPLAFAMLNTANSDAKVCDATIKCIDSQCSDAAKECAGPDYKSQSYTGTCASYLNCVKGCNCAKACVDKCDPGTVDCSECLSLDLAFGCTLKCVSEIASCGSK
jgi:hypothetical protein